MEDSFLPLTSCAATCLTESLRLCSHGGNHPEAAILELNLPDPPSHGGCHPQAVFAVGRELLPQRLFTSTINTIQGREMGLSGMDIEALSMMTNTMEETT